MGSTRRDSGEGPPRKRHFRWPQSVTLEPWQRFPLDSQQAMTDMVRDIAQSKIQSRHIDAMKERERRDFHFEFTTLRFKPVRIRRLGGSAPLSCRQGLLMSNSIYATVLGEDFQRFIRKIQERFGFDSKSGSEPWPRSDGFEYGEDGFYTIPFCSLGTWRNIMFPDQGECSVYH